MELDFTTRAGKTRANNWYLQSKVSNKKIKERINESHKRENFENVKVVLKDKLRVGSNNKAWSKLLAPMKGSLDSAFDYPLMKKIVIEISRKFKCFIGKHDWQLVTHYWENTSEKRQVLRKIENPVECKCSYCPKTKKAVK
jgi:hypothetical protein